MAEPFIVWVPDIVVKYAWNIYRADNEDADPTYDLPSFRRNIANCLLQKHNTRTDSLTSRVPRGRVLSANRRVSIDVRYDGFMNFQEQFDVTKRWQSARKIQRRDAKIAMWDYTIIASKTGTDYNK